MKILYLDCPSGASGNMLIASLIEAGVPEEFLIDELKKLPVDNYQIKTETVYKNGFAATFFQVIESADKTPHRNLQDIITIINNSNLNAGLKEKSLSIFRKLAAAEAKVHGVDINKIHFHEVGATDAIIDIVGTLIALDYLKLDQIIASPLPLGSGFVNCQHGKLPIPAPATMELIKNFPIKKTEIAAELLTPTAAAIISTLATSFGTMPSITISNIGYGAGSYNLPIPNILRAIIGYSEDSLPEQEVCVIECNIDDMNPEFYPFIIDRLLSSGALDVCLIPIIMKKGRPGILLQAIAPQDSLAKLSNIILSESTSLGIRIRYEKRCILERKLVQISTPQGELTVKVAFKEGKIINISPEYEDCKKIALEKGLAIKSVYEMAIVEANKSIKKEVVS